MINTLICIYLLKQKQNLYKSSTLIICHVVSACSLLTNRGRKEKQIYCKSHYKPPKTLNIIFCKYKIKK